MSSTYCKPAQKPAAENPEPNKPNEPRTNPTTIGILSDTHGLVRPEVEQALAGCHHILHAGDVGDEQRAEPAGTNRSGHGCPWKHGPRFMVQFIADQGDGGDRRAFFFTFCMICTSWTWTRLPPESMWSSVGIPTSLKFFKKMASPTSIREVPATGGSIIRYPSPGFVLKTVPPVLALLKSICNFTHYHRSTGCRWETRSIRNPISPAIFSGQEMHFTIHIGDDYNHIEFVRLDQRSLY